MAQPGNILLVDDEDLFRISTADLLKKSGYNCDCGTNGIIASKMLEESCYDLLIADIKMHGNNELELIHDLQIKHEGIPVILITGYPSLKTSIASIQLPVEAYMIKPIDFEELLENVNRALRRSDSIKKVQGCRDRLKSLDHGLFEIEHMLSNATGQNPLIPIETFISLTTNNIINCALDLKKLISGTDVHADDKNICHLYNCPKLNAMKGGLNDTIETLEKTKKSFKSKELAMLRTRLESLLKDP